MLYLCATPIGNLGDITYRVVETLKNVDVIAAEDTRNTIKLLNHFEINTSMISYHEHNRYEMTPVLVDRMVQGENIALVTDAGTPAISDPGEDLVRACHKAGVEVTSLPGATAFTTALTLSGMDARGFMYEGFLSQDKKKRQPALDRLSKSTVTTIFYEAPHRLVKTLEILEKVVDTPEGIVDREVCICKELTKKHEKMYRFSSVSEAVHFFREKEEPRGEFVIVIAGRSEDEVRQEERRRWDDIKIEDHVKMYMDEGLDKKSAMKKVADDRGISKRDVYQTLLSSPVDL